MATLNYAVKGYKNTGYTMGSPTIPFNRPLTKEIFHSLYANSDDYVDFGTCKLDVIDVYNKQKIKLTYSDYVSIGMVDYLTIQDVNSLETAYYFVLGSSRNSKNSITYNLQIDEQTTTDFISNVSIDGIIKKCNVLANGVDYSEGNYLPEEFSPANKLLTKVGFIDIENGTGYTLASGSIKSGSRTFVTLLGIVSSYDEANNEYVISPLSGSFGEVSVTLGGSTTTVFPNQIIADLSNDLVKDQMTRLRELGGSNFIGGVFSVPEQLISSTSGGTTGYNNFPYINTLNYSSLLLSCSAIDMLPSYTPKYKKSAALYTSFLLSSLSNGDSKTFTLQEIAESSSSSDLSNGVLRLTVNGTGVSGGGTNWRPYQYDLTDAVGTVTNRTNFIGNVRGADWNVDGCYVTGVENAPLLNVQAYQTEKQYEIANQVIARNNELSNINLDIARGNREALIAAGGVSTLFNTVTGDFSGALGSLTNTVLNTMDSRGASGKSYGFLAERQKEQQNFETDIVRQQNTLSNDAFNTSYKLLQGTQNIALIPSGGTDLSRLWSGSLMIQRMELTTEDIQRFDKYFDWFGCTVHELYNGKLINHYSALKGTNPFNYLQLGACLCTLSNTGVIWGQNAGWKDKMMSEVQNGGRYWRSKIN